MDRWVTIVSKHRVDAKKQVDTMKLRVDLEGMSSLARS